jgi:hypothetical protein
MIFLETLWSLRVSLWRLPMAVECCLTRTLFCLIWNLFCLLCFICKALYALTWQYWKVWLQEWRCHRLKILKLQKSNVTMSKNLKLIFLCFFFVLVLMICTFITQKCEVLSTPVLWSQQPDLNGVIMVLLSWKYHTHPAGPYAWNAILCREV